MRIFRDLAELYRQDFDNQEDFFDSVQHLSSNAHMMSTDLRWMDEVKTLDQCEQILKAFACHAKYVCEAVQHIQWVLDDVKQNEEDRKQDERKAAKKKTRRVGSSEEPK